MNGKDGIVAAVVQYTNNGRPHAVRVLAPDGSQFDITENTKKEEPTTAHESRESGTKSPISPSADKVIISRDISQEAQKNSVRSAAMTTERIDELISDSGAGSRKDYARMWITSINPSDFLNMTLQRENQDREVFDSIIRGDYGSTNSDFDYLSALVNEKRQTPFLAIDINTGEVVGHEGRHRMRALEKAGIQNVDIVVEFRDEDGHIIKEMNGYGNPLEIIQEMKILNQRGTGQSTMIRNIIPLNKENRENVLANYGGGRRGV